MLFTRLLQQLPSLCAVCRSWGQEAICDDCRQRYTAVTARCELCALPLPLPATVCGECLRTPPPFDAATVGVAYAHPWSSLIAHFKFHEGLELGPALAALLAAAVSRRAGALPEVLLPVPLSAERLRDRGYNQAWNITRRLADNLHLPADAHLLLRTRHSPHQLDLPPDARAANVHGVFAVEPLRRQAVQGKHIAVIDDVMTTGATFAEIARVLKQAGAARVEAWAVARTARDTA